MPTEGRAGELIDALRVQNTILCAAQANAVELMMEFAAVRKPLDKQRISNLKREGVDPRYEAGEFAAMEIGAAVNASKYTVQRLVAMAHRLRAECPNAYDTWKAGDICQERAVRINRALRRLVKDSSKQRLNSVVVEVAVGQTPELLGRWLNQFVALIEPDEQDERLHRAMEDRYASIRPDLDGMSFLSALMSSVDAAAVDRILTALAAAAEPGDLRTMAQRRSDALVDMLCGRISNGCHVVWDANTDTDDHLDDEVDDDPPRGDQPCSDQPHNDQPHNDQPHKDQAHEHQAHSVSVASNVAPSGSAICIGDADGNRDGSVQPTDVVGGSRAHRETGVGHSAATDDGVSADADAEESLVRSDVDWEDSDWEQPASVFRPDRRNGPAGDDRPGTSPPDRPGISPPDRPGASPPGRPLPPEIAGRTGNGSWRITPCPGEHQVNPAPVTIGVVVSIQSLFGLSNTPGQLLDRSALVAADQIRELAQQRGTLFYRLLTDGQGHLLDVTEMGRFPSRKLALGIKFRDGMCTGPTCHKAATDCDMDHVVPHPEGPTTASNLNNDCKPEHRAKTFAGHVTARTGPHTTSWTMPTGHTYLSEDPALPAEEWVAME